MSNLTLTIDGKSVSVPAGTSILVAARVAGIRIPSLCYAEDQAVKANCRICVVEVEGMRGLQPACATAAAEGMVVHTNTPDVIDARRNNLQLILSHHPMDCQSCARLGACHIEDLSEELCSWCFYCECVKDGSCELQALAKEYAVDDLCYDWRQKELPLDTSLPSIVRNPNKCILCRRCVESCGAGQGVYVWNVTKRGNETSISTFMDKPMDQTACVECGQCVRHCPVGALYEHQELDDIRDAAQDKKTHVVVQADPYFLDHYLTFSKQEDKGYTAENLAAGMFRLHVDQVVGNGAAEEEYLRRLSDEIAAADGVVLGASCPSVVKFVEKNFPQLADRLSKVPSPQQIFGELAQKKGAEGKQVYTVALSACSAKKAEAARADKGGAVSQVMSPREITRLFGVSGVNLAKLPARALDGAQRDLKASPAAAARVEAELEIRGRRVKAAAACGLRAVRELLQEIASGACEYQYVQLLACPDGCISTDALLVK